MFDILFIAEGPTGELFIEKILQYFNELHDITLNTHTVLLGVSGGLKGDIIDEISTNLINYQYNYAMTMLDLDDLGMVKNFQTKHDRVYSIHKNSHSRSIALEQYLTAQIKIEMSQKLVDNLLGDDGELKQVTSQFIAYIQPYVGDCLVLGQLDLYLKYVKEKHKLSIKEAIKNQSPEDIRKNVIKNDILSKKYSYNKPPKKFIEQCELQVIAQVCPHFAQNMFNKIDEIYQNFKIERNN